MGTMNCYKSYAENEINLRQIEEEKNGTRPRKLEGFKKSSQNGNKIVESIHSSASQALPINTIQSNFVHYFVSNTMLCIIYDLEKNVGKKIVITNKTIPQHHDSVQVGSRVFLSGGYNPKSDFELQHKTKFTFEFIESKRILMPRADMNHPKALHALVAINPNTFYSIGGENTTGNIKITEKYNIIQDKWKEAPPLNKEKFCTSACVFNEHLLFTFGGIEYDYSRFIERLDTNLEKKGFEIIVLSTFSSPAWTGRYWTGAIQISNEEILVFGGMTHSKSKDVFIFNIKNNTMNLMGELLLKPAYFWQKPIQYENHAYAFSFYDNDIHIFNLEDRIWSIKEEREWMNEEVFTTQGN